MAAPLPAFSDIGEYAIIGNCHTAALVSRHGSIDWWCPFRFDAPSIFAAILDPRVGGRWWVGPERDAYVTRRRYIEDTNVLETTFETAGGVLRLTDFMPMREGKEGLADGLEPRLAIMRCVECVEGEVAVGVHYEPRWSYGRYTARLEDRGRDIGIFTERRGDALTLRSEIPLRILGGAAGGHEVLRAGEVRYLGVGFAENEPLILPPLGRAAGALVEDTIGWWHDWMSQLRYDGPYQTAVRRSALTLKLLCFAPSGAVIASPTTSLPEGIGGERNWDYRYCWLRDASMTMRSLLDLGFLDEASEFLNWLIIATQLTAPKLDVLYDVYGNNDIYERTVEWLRGYRGSRPVRIGNAAAHQRQLDLYGEVTGAALTYVRHGGHLDGFKGRLLVGLGKTVCREWDRPDAGIWEIRGDWRQHTHSKVNCWRTLDALLELERRDHLRVPGDRFRRTAEQIREAIETRGFDRDSGSYVSTFGGRAVDASLLLLGLQGYVDPRHPRMIGTWRRLRRELKRDGLWYRYAVSDYDDGLRGDEGAFGICSFWAVEYLARIGRRDEATRTFEQLLGYANDVGLYAEEIEPGTGACLGNFPQGFTHVGLISAALALAGRTEQPLAEGPQQAEAS